MAIHTFLPAPSGAGHQVGGLTPPADLIGNTGVNEERTMEQVQTYHDGYYHRLKEDAAKALKHLCGFRLEPTCRDGVRECVMMVLGISLEEAETLFNAIEWLHSDHETKEHKH